MIMSPLVTILNQVALGAFIYILWSVIINKREIVYFIVLQNQQS